MATYESKKYRIIPVDAEQIADGSVDNAEYQRLANVTSDIQTQLNARLSSAGGSMTGALAFADNVKATFGGAADLEIFHDANDSIIADTGTGALEIRASILNMRNAADTHDMFKATEGGAVELYHNNSKKAETTSGGLTVTGTVSATSGSFTNVSGNGSSLTSIPAGNLTGTVADARLSTVSSSKLSGALPAIDGSALTGIAIAPSGTTDVGSLREFQFRTVVGNVFASVSVSEGTDITFPYVVSGMGLKNGSDVTTAGTNSGGGSVTRGLVGSSASFTGGSNATFTGTWRCFASPKTGSFTTGSGQNAVTRYYSIPGLFQRVS